MKKNKDIDLITRKLIREVPLDSPSSNFVNKVMDAVDLEGRAVKLENYRPLISKWGWLIILSCVVGLSLYLITLRSNNMSFLSDIDFSFIEKYNVFNFIGNLHFSKLFSFSFIFFSGFVWLQIVVIKRYLLNNHWT